MRILYVLQAVQHPTMRGSLRHYHFLRSLAQRHSITLLALSRTRLTPAAQCELAEQTKRALIFHDDASRAGGRVMRRLRLERVLWRMKEAFVGLAKPDAFDLVLFHGKSAYPVIRGYSGLPIVADFCDATAMRHRLGLRHARGAERVWQLPQYLSMRRIERELSGQTPHLAFISERDRSVAMGSRERGTVIPNGIDLTYWTRSSPERQPDTIIFTGVMDYAPNEDAALFLIRSVMPRLRATVPGIAVLIVGRSPRPRLVEAARACAGVTITGHVEDMRPWLQRASVFVAPLRFSAGMQNKVLEAMAMEVPVVATPLVAAGLRAKGVFPPVDTAETAADLAARILALLPDAAAQTRRATEGRAFVREHFDWQRSAALLEELCLSAVDTVSRPEPSAYGVSA